MTKPTEPTPAAPAAPAQAKRTYRRRSITTGPGTKLVMEQEQKLAEARKIARALNDVETMSKWGIEQIQQAIRNRECALVEVTTST